MSDNLKAIAKFVANFQDSVDAYYNNNFDTLIPSVLTTKKGRKFVKVITTNDGGNGQSSVAAFINIENGDIMKPASWNAPAKHARGNVNSDQGGLEALDGGGSNIRYMGC